MSQSQPLARISESAALGEGHGTRPDRATVTDGLALLSSDLPRSYLL